MPTKKTIFLFCLVLFVVACARAQVVGKKTKEIKSKEIVYATVDRLGNLFIVSKNNVIKKFDAQGKLMATLKSKNVSLLEPWYHPTIFVYDHRTQKYWIYGRHFENEKELALEPAWAIRPTLACPSNDNKLWLFDLADASIKKVNPFTKEVLVEFSTDTSKVGVAPRYTHLREYQNMIFLLDQQSGISIYSHIGRKIHEIQKKDIGNFNFFGEELYYLDGDKMKFFDLGSAETREIAIEGDNKFVLATDERFILINQKNKILWYENKPKD